MMNLFLEDTGMVLKKKSLISDEVSPEAASSEAFSRNLMSLGLILKPLEFISPSSFISFFALLTDCSSPWRNILLPLMEVSIPRVSSIILRLLSSLSCIDDRSLSSPRSSSNLTVSLLLNIYGYTMHTQYIVLFT
jgi:hypothetical protein